MLTSTLRLAILIGGCIISAPAAFAAAGDYRFDLVSARPAATGKTDVTVRLTLVADGKPVGGAIISSRRPS